MGLKFDLRQCPLWPFLLTYLCALVFFPHLRLFFSSPLLVAALYQKNWVRFLWFGLSAGVFLDLLSSDYPIGFYGAAFLLTCAGLSKLKQRFFSDNLSTLPIMTFFASLFQTLSTVVLSPFFDLTPHLSAAWFFTDILCMPILDAAAAFILFILVPMLFKSRSRKRQDYFMKDNP